MIKHSSLQPVIDYVRYIVPMDVDRIQQFGAFINGAMSDGKVTFGHGKGFRLKVGDSTASTGGKRRLILDAWGDASRELIDLLDSGYMQYITRLDYRRVLPGVDKRGMAGYVTKMIMGRKSKRNIVTYNTNPRQKTDSRDVGGYGLTIGSRKSDSHTTAYVRGDEPAAIEHRFQGAKAQDIAAKAMIPAFDMEEPGNVSDHILSELRVAALVELNQATGYRNYETLAAEMMGAADQMEMVKQSLDFSEDQAEADAWWETQTLEQQEDAQQAGYLPSETLQPQLRDPRRVEGVQPPPDMRHED